MRFFSDFKEDTVREQWFPIKSPHSSQPVECGEIHLRLSVPGGSPSQVGKAFKVTGVRMDTRKLLVHVVAGRVLTSAKTGAPRTTYVKLVVPNNVGVWGETSRQKRTTTPEWDEVFEFYAEVKNTPYLLVKLKMSKAIGNKTLGLSKIPLLFYLSLKDTSVMDAWFPVRDPQRKVVAHVRLRLDVCQRESTTDERYGQVHPTSSKAPPGPPSPKQADVAAAPAVPPSDSPHGEASEDPLLEEEEDEEDEEDSEAALFPNTSEFDAPWDLKGSGGCVMWPPPDGKMPDGLDSLPPSNEGDSPRVPRRQRADSCPASPRGYPTTGPGPFFMDAANGVSRGYPATSVDVPSGVPVAV